MKSNLKEALKFINPPDAKDLMEKVELAISELKELELKNN